MYWARGKRRGFSPGARFEIGRHLFLRSDFNVLQCPISNWTSFSRRRAISGWMSPGM